MTAKVLAELVGTMLLILLGNGVVANVCLKKSKAEGSGWIVITTGWALAVMIPVFIFGPTSGAHFNPAVTISMAMTQQLPWREVPMYIASQFVGAILGACLVYLHYLPHWKETECSDVKLGCFATAPAINHKLGNFISEFIGTFVLVFALLGVSNTEMVEGLSPIVVGAIIWLIGLTLGGTTGYAINPARDLGPRIAYTLLPIPDKGSAKWNYAWVPVLAPLLGGIVAALVYQIIF
ncbi:MAG: MIP/aquaporin family protein [Cellulosilyticaceae bacterium]